jgi:hypothetical protein
MLCINVCTATAQQGFVYEDLANDTTEYVASAVELRDGGYVAALRKITAGATLCKVVRLDKNGALLRTALLSDNKYLLINAVTETEVGILLFGTASNGVSGDFVSILLNDDLTIASQSTYPLGNFQQSGVYATPLDSFILVSGAIVEEPYFRSFLGKIAPDGSIIDFNPLFVNDLISNGLFRESDQRFLFFGYFLKTYEADIALNFVKESGKTPYGLELEGGMAWGNDSTILLVGKRVNSMFEPPYDNTQNIGIGVLDQNWNKKNLYQIGLPKDTIDYPAYNTPVSISGSQHIFVGGTAAQDGFWLYGKRLSWFVLAKLRPDNFSPEWVKYYGGNAYYSMFGVLATSDGGCLMYGAKYTKQGKADADAYMIKVAGDGQTTSTGPDVNTSLQEIKVFPNPVSNLLSIYSAQQPFRFDLFDVSGKLILSRESNLAQLDVDLSALLPAAYYYKVSSGSVLSGLLLKH